MNAASAAPEKGLAMIASDRARQLVARMSPAEKLGQLQIVFRPDQDEMADRVRAGLGAIFWPRSARAVNALQRVAVEETRLGIPLLVGLDVVHGQRTIAPVPLAQAAAFDPEMAEHLARLAAREARSGGVTWTFSPMADISYDPRWGRVVEGYGEDVHLTSRMTGAMVRGYQGAGLSSDAAIAATAKHFVGYGFAEGGRDYNTVDVSERRLRDVLLAPFRAAVAESAAAVMASFNTIAGTPMHTHRRLLTGVLKEEWGFGGIIVGDAEGVRNLLAHGVAGNIADAVRLAYSAGLDVEMGGVPGELNADALAALPAARIDDAVTRVLMLKEALGLFEQPYSNEGDEITEPGDDSRRLVRRAAARGSVLLKNDGTLPLPASSTASLRRVLVTGPYARSTDHLGAWTQSFGAPARSIAEVLAERRPDIDFAVLPGVDFTDDDAAGIEEVVAATADVDLVLVCAGEPSRLSGEAASRSDLRLPGRQEDLIRAIAATGTPFVVVLENGRPLVTADWIDQAPTVVEAWHGGTEAAEAIVDVLFGDEDPAGRLPMTFPRSVGQVPIYYAHENTGRPASVRGSMDSTHVDIGLDGPANVQDKYTSKYLDLDLGPQFCFGHGGGYASFAHGAPRISVPSISVDELRAGGAVAVDIEIANTSERDGDEVVQLYVEDIVASAAPPVRRLISFERRSIAAGENAAVVFEVRWSDLAQWSDAEGADVVEPGLFRLHLGPRLDDTQAVEFSVSGR